MKVIVTGGAGFIGSAVCRLLAGQKGCKVLNLDKLTYAAEEIIPLYRKIFAINPQLKGCSKTFNPMR